MPKYIYVSLPLTFSYIEVITPGPLSIQYFHNHLLCLLLIMQLHLTYTEEMLRNNLFEGNVRFQFQETSVSFNEHVVRWREDSVVWKKRNITKLMLRFVFDTQVHKFYKLRLSAFLLSPCHTRDAFAVRPEKPRNRIRTHRDRRKPLDIYDQVVCSAFLLRSQCVLNAFLLRS